MSLSLWQRESERDLILGRGQPPTEMIEIMTQTRIQQGIEILKKGGVIAFPTDTVYGLGAAYDDIAAAERIYRVKNRPLRMALPVLVFDEAQIKQVAVDIPPEAHLLIDSFEPGKLTLVLKKSAKVPDVVTGGGSTVAVRITAHPIPLALIKGIGKPIIATSANVHGQPTAISADDVRSQVGDKIDLIIEGQCPVGTESTIIDVTGKIPMIVRQGAITKEEIKRICPDIR
jgi:L-threonylcarbamoyladenylate synthase